MPGDPLFRVFYVLGFVALTLAMVAGVYVAWDDWRERRKGVEDGQD